MFKFLAVAGIMCLVGCTSTSEAPTTGFQSQIEAACSDAMLLANVDPAIGVYITAGCGTEEAIAALAANPTSLAWVNDLIAKVKAEM